MVYLLLHSSSSIELPRLRRCSLFHLQLCAATSKPTRCAISNKWRRSSAITESTTSWWWWRSCESWLGRRSTRWKAAYAVRITYCLGEMAEKKGRLRLGIYRYRVKRRGSKGTLRLVRVNFQEGGRYGVS